MPSYRDWSLIKSKNWSLTDLTLYFTNSALGSVSGKGRTFLNNIFSPQTLRLVNERSFISVRQQLPVRPESLGYFWVVHFWVLLRHLPPLASRPDHEGVHRPLDVIHRLGPGTHLTPPRWELWSLSGFSSCPDLSSWRPGGCRGLREEGPTDNWEVKIKFLVTDCKSLLAAGSSPGIWHRPSGTLGHPPPHSQPALLIGQLRAWPATWLDGQQGRRERSVIGGYNSIKIKIFTRNSNHLCRFALGASGGGQALPLQQITRRNYIFKFKL